MYNYSLQKDYTMFKKYLYNKSQEQPIKYKSLYEKFEIFQKLVDKCKQSSLNLGKKNVGELAVYVKNNFQISYDFICLKTHNLNDFKNLIESDNILLFLKIKENIGFKYKKI